MASSPYTIIPAFLILSIFVHITYRWRYCHVCAPREGFAKDLGSTLAVDQNSANPDTAGQLTRR
jgi:hypothetical protein